MVLPGQLKLLSGVLCAIFHIELTRYRSNTGYINVTQSLQIVNNSVLLINYMRNYMRGTS